MIKQLLTIASLSAQKQFAQLTIVSAAATRKLDAVVQDQREAKGFRICLAEYVADGGDLTNEQSWKRFLATKTQAESDVEHAESIPPVIFTPTRR